MNRLALIFASCLLLASSAACSGGFYFGKPEKNDYTLISQDEAKKIIDSEQGVVVVDVRRQDEYDQGHIPGAVLIPNETIQSTPPPQLPDMNQKILVYCRSGNRSKQAAQKLADMGYTNIYEFGGINTWQYGTEMAQPATEPETEPRFPSLITSAADIALYDPDGQGWNYVFTYNGENFSVDYEYDNWHITDSYKIRNHDDIVIICQALADIHPIHGADLESYRTAEDMAYEWEQHNMAYNLLPEDSQWKGSAKDVDIDPKDQGKSMYQLFKDRLSEGER